MTFKLTKMSYLLHKRQKKVCLRRVWIRLTTAYLLCAQEFRQNNALALQFWCLSNALTLRVRALGASKSQRACIILSKFTRKSKYAVINLYTSSPFLFTDYPLYLFCLQFTAQTVIFDNVAQDCYLTKDFNNGLGNEVRPNWRSRNTDSSSKLYLDISTIYHALMSHNSRAFLLHVMTFQKEFRLVTLIFKLIQISNRSGVEGSVLMTLKGKSRSLCSFA